MRAVSFKTWACRLFPKKSHKLGPRCKCPSAGARGADDKVLLANSHQAHGCDDESSGNRHLIARHLWGRTVSLGGVRSVLLMAIVTLCHRCRRLRTPVSRTHKLMLFLEIMAHRAPLSPAVLPHPSALPHPSPRPGSPARCCP